MKWHPVPTFLIFSLSASVAIAEAPAISEACAKAFRAAAGVSEYQDKHEDLFPAYSACTSVLEWKAADESYPNAIDGVEPVSYAMTVCAYNQRELGNTPICRAVNAEDQ